MAKLTRTEYDALKRQIDNANTPDQLMEAASGFGITFTAGQMDKIREQANAEVSAEEQRRIANAENEQLAADLRRIQNDGIRQSSKFVNWLLYQAAIAAVLVLFAGEVLRLTPVVGTMLDVPWWVAWIPTAMILVGYYVTALIGKHERKESQAVIINARLRAKAEKYLRAESLTVEEEREGRAAAETLRSARRAGRGYGMVEWTLFIGLHLLTVYHTIELHAGESELPFLLVGAVMSIFLQIGRAHV
jgi:hypothetical protein